MLCLNYNGIQDRNAWATAGVTLPNFDWKEMSACTKRTPVWIHFGAGNIFRGFIARLQQVLLNQGLAKCGIVAADTFDYDIIDKIYDPFDNMSILVSLMPDGSMKKEVVASVAKGLRAGSAYPEDMEQLKNMFRRASLQMVSFTITEKGYALTNIKGQFFPIVEADFENGPAKCSHAMSLIASLLLERFLAGGTPLAMVSMDNCSHNGEKLRASIMTIVDHWLALGRVPKEFAAWVRDESQVAFPWTMIDKITPRPSEIVKAELEDAGISYMTPIITGKNTFIAPFVNAEAPQYLVVEDHFPNGRPPLEKAGVYLSDRDTVNNAERMKVTTCLNPLHTALAVYGCLLGYHLIADEMKDPELHALVQKIGYSEGMPVVIDPQIFSPETFIHEVMNERLPNPFIPDTPQRIATDTSQKLSIRFGETIKGYCDRPDLEVTSLTYIPLAIAGWIRYLLALDDKGQPMECSSDPMLAGLQAQLSGVTLGHPESLGNHLEPILTNQTLFGADLIQVGLGDKIEHMVRELISGPGAVRATLKKYLKN